MNWQKVCDNPVFQNIPFKVETNKWGKVVMTPGSNEHGIYQAMMVEWFVRLAQGGKAISECSVQTINGVKVADVAWASFEFFKRNGLANPYLESPEILVEILSSSNTRKEMDEKKELYFARGAREFWICDGGKMSFFNNHNELKNSDLIPDFPCMINIDFV